MTYGTEPDNEWFEIFNPTGSDVPIGHWSVSSDNGNYTFGAFTVEAYDAVVIASNGTAFYNAYGFEPDIDTKGSLPELANAGDWLTLNDGAADVDHVEWGSPSTSLWTSRPEADSGESIQRVENYPDTDGDSDWTSNMASETPGVSAMVVYSADLDTTALSEGEHTLTIQVTDSSGAVTSTTLNIFVDNVVLTEVVISELDTSKGFSNTTGIGNLIHDTAFIVAHPDPATEAKYGELFINDGYAGYDNTLEGTAGSEFFEFEVDTVGYGDGSFRFRVVVYDSQGSSVSDTVVTTIENTPVVYVNDPTDGEVLAGVKTLNLTAYDRNGMSGAELRVDGGPWTAMTAVHSGVYPEPSYYEIEWDTTGATDGPHSLSFLVTDDGPNSVTKMSSVDVIVDNNIDDPTQCSIVSPTPSEFVEGIFRLQISGWDPNGIGSIEISIDNSSWIEAVYDSATGFYGHSFDTKVLSDGGPHSLEARATDSAGNMVNVSLDNGFYVDNDIPIPTSIKPSEGSVVTGEVFIIVSTVDATISPYGSVEYRIDDGPWIDMEDLSTPHEASWHSTSYLDGEHTLTIKTTDAVGHEDVSTIELTVDNTAPTVSTIQPGPGQYVSGSVSFLIKAHDSVGIGSVTLVFNGTPYDAHLNTASGYYELEIDTRTYSDGVFLAEAQVEDLAGWTTVTGDFIVRIDNSEPSLSANIHDGAYVSGTVVVAGNFSISDEFLFSAEYRIDDGGWNGISVPWNTVEYSEGQHLISLRASDAIGNEVSSTVKVFVDNLHPEIGYVSVSEGETLHAVEQLAVSALDENGIHRVTFSIDDGEPNHLLASPATGLFEYDIDTMLFVDGEHTIGITVTDLGGWTVSTDMTVSIDNTGPGTTIRSITVNTDGLVTVSVDAADPSGISEVQINIDGQGWTEMVFDDKTSRYRYIYKTSERDNGKHWAEVRTVDRLGNEATATQSFNVDNPPDYIGAIVDLVPLIAFLFLVILVLLGLLMWKMGKLGSLFPGPGKTEEKAVSPVKGVKDVKTDAQRVKKAERKPVKRTEKPEKRQAVTPSRSKTPPKVDEDTEDRIAKFEDLLAKVEKGSNEARRKRGGDEL